jgi:hypothetical protein
MFCLFVSSYEFNNFPSIEGTKKAGFFGNFNTILHQFPVIHPAAAENLLFFYFIPLNALLSGRDDMCRFSESPQPAALGPVLFQYSDRN